MNFSDSEGGLVYRERLSPWHRLLVVVFGMGMWVIPVIVLHQASANNGTIDLLMLAVGVVVPLLAGLFFIGIALVGTKQLRFDGTHRKLHISTRGPLGRRQVQVDYQQVESIDVLRREGLDDPAHYLLLLKVSGRRVMELGGFANATEAEQWRQRLQSELQGA